MPYINIRLGCALENEQRQQLYAQTTLLMNRVMRKRKEVTVVHIQESKAQQWATNGVVISGDDPISAYVDIKVTAGTNSVEEKETMLTETTNMLRRVVGAMQEACYIVIDEIPANAWGYSGISQAARAGLNESKEATASSVY